MDSRVRGNDSMLQHTEDILMKSRHAIIIAIVLLVFASSAYAQQLPDRFVTDTLTVSMLKAQFNKDVGTPRLILLLSPT